MVILGARGGLRHWAGLCDVGLAAGEPAVAETEEGFFHEQV